MNIRKPVDYTDLYAQLETALCRNKKQMDQYAAIGKAVALRSEKGAAVAAADYIREAHPELSGFSPRNLRRMRAFYQTYGIRSLGIAVVVLIRKIVRAFRTSVTASEDRTTDVCAIADNHVGSIIFILALIFYHRHIATSIDVLVESAAIDGDVGLAIDASHIREGRDGIGAI